MFKWIKQLFEKESEHSAYNVLPCAAMQSEIIANEFVGEKQSFSEPVNLIVESLKEEGRWTWELLDGIVAQKHYKVADKKIGFIFHVYRSTFSRSNFYYVDCEWATHEECKYLGGEIVRMINSQKSRSVKKHVRKSRLCTRKHPMQNKTLQYRDIEKTFPHFTRTFSQNVGTIPSSKLMSLGLGATTLRNIVAGYNSKTIPKDFDFFDESLSDVDVSTLDFFVVDPYLVFKLNRDVVQKDANEIFTNIYADRIYKANERSGGEFCRLIEQGGSWLDWEIATSYSELAQVRKGLRPNIYRSEIEAARKTILKSLVNLYNDDEVHQFVGQYVKSGHCWSCDKERKLLKCLSKLEYGTQEYNKAFDSLYTVRRVGSEMQSIMERLKDAE